MKPLLIILMTAKFGFAAADSITSLKLVEHGFKKENLALILALAFPLETIVITLFNKWSNHRPLNSVSKPNKYHVHSKHSTIILVEMVLFSSVSPGICWLIHCILLPYAIILLLSNPYCHISRCLCTHLYTNVCRNGLLLYQYCR